VSEEIYQRVIQRNACNVFLGPVQTGPNEQDLRLAFKEKKDKKTNLSFLENPHFENAKKLQNTMDSFGQSVREFSLMKCFFSPMKTEDSNAFCKKKKKMELSDDEKEKFKKAVGIFVKTNGRKPTLSDYKTHPSFVDFFNK
jgi:hypothetical protein